MHIFDLQNRHMKKLLFLIPVLVFVFSCKKYEDGPFVSIYSKTHRVENTWTVEAAYDNGTDITNDFKTWYPNYIISLTKSHTYILTYNLNSGVEYRETGTWAYTEKRTHLVFTNSANGNQSDWKILRLKEKSLWGEHVYTTMNPQRTIELHLKPLF